MSMPMIRHELCKSVDAAQTSPIEIRPAIHPRREANQQMVGHQQWRRIGLSEDGIRKILLHSGHPVVSSLRCACSSNRAATSNKAFSP